MLGKDENVIPSSFDYHFGIVDKFSKQFILNFTVELVFEHFYEINHCLNQFHQLLIFEYSVFIFQ